MFQTVTKRLGVTLLTHMPAGQDGRRPTARAKGKVERPFRTAKEAHETLYHFHQPQSEAEANAWLADFVNRYNEKPHRREAHSRIEDGLAHLPERGLRELERRKVAGDARIAVAGTHYEVDPELAGEEVILWWGLFDHELFVEFGDKRYGPYRPVGGPIPLHRYRKHKKSAREKRADRVAALAEQLSVPRSALAGSDTSGSPTTCAAPGRTPFNDPDPWNQLAYASALDARRGIADLLARPLGKLPEEDLQFITEVLSRTLDKAEIAIAVRTRFQDHKT